ncbi:MAG: thermonuclease family protein [Chloroflexota bacterium]|nr:thermonuclease family protein [Chloroflexota bacterium]
MSVTGLFGLLAAALLVACQAVVVPSATPISTTPGAAPTPTLTFAPPFDPTPPPFQPHGETQEATVTYIVDGDTIHVEIGGQEYRVRYIGIDAPEIAHDTNPGEPLGPEATQANADLVEGERVILEKDTSDTDQFGRLLRYVWLPTGPGPIGWVMVNLELAKEGMADVKRYPPDTYWQKALQQAESNAREAGLGIWSN